MTDDQHSPLTDEMPAKKPMTRRLIDHFLLHKEGYTLALTAFTAAVSAFGALAAWQAAKIASNQVTYSAKLQAITTFARAAETFSSAVRVATFDMREEVFSADYSPLMTNDQVVEAATIARRVLDARTPYVAELDAQAAIWSEATTKLIAESQTESLAASSCFLQLGAQSNKRTDLALRAEREALADACPGASSVENLTRIEVAMKTALTAMSKELAQSAR